MPAKKAAKKTAPAKRASQAPQARQCRDPESDMFGAVAVASGENRWGVMEPINPTTGRGGGHWANDEQVKDWTVL